MLAFERVAAVACAQRLVGGLDDADAARDARGHPESDDTGAGGEESKDAHDGDGGDGGGAGGDGGALQLTRLYTS